MEAREESREEVIQTSKRRQSCGRQPETVKAYTGSLSNLL